MSEQDDADSRGDPSPDPPGSPESPRSPEPGHGPGAADDAHRSRGAHRAQGPHGHHTARGVEAPRPTLVHRWRNFAHSPFFPACVVVLIVAAAAGLFASSYTYAMADPTPRRIPAGIVGAADVQRATRGFVSGMEKELGSSLDLHHYRTFGQAKQAVDGQKIFMVLRMRAGGTVEMDIASASGASVAEVLQQTGPKVGKALGRQVVIKDLKPLGKGDPRGLVIFYMTLAAVIIGFIGAIQLNVNVPALTRPQRIGFIVVYSLLGGLIIAVMVGRLLEAVHLPFVQSWSILSLTMFTSGAVYLMFNTLFGRWSMIPTWFLLVLLGNPSSGGAVSWPLLPSVLGTVGRWLPPGASVNAQHTAVYFPGHQHLQPYLVLGAWAVAGVAVFSAVRPRPAPDD